MVSPRRGHKLAAGRQPRASESGSYPVQAWVGFSFSNDFVRFGESCDAHAFNPSSSYAEVAGLDLLGARRLAIKAGHRRAHALGWNRAPGRRQGLADLAQLGVGWLKVDSSHSDASVSGWGRPFALSVGYAPARNLVV